jgi:hypothetical protein
LGKNTALLSLSEFLAAAPKTVVIKWHRRENDKGGLQQANRVAQKVFEWALGDDRIATALEDLGEDGRLSLLWIYASGRRGLKESEILNAQETPLHLAQFALAKIEHELFACVREGESASFHGFAEMAVKVLPALVKESLPQEATGLDTPISTISWLRWAWANCASPKAANSIAKTCRNWRNALNFPARFPASPLKKK